MITFGQWRKKIQEQNAPSPMKPMGDPMDAPKGDSMAKLMSPPKPARQPPPTRPTTEDDEKTKADFGWLKYFFEKNRRNIPSAMRTGVRSRLQPFARGMVSNEIGPDVESAKDEFAQHPIGGVKASGKATFRDVPTVKAMQFAIDAMAAAMRAILPGETGTGKTFMASPLKKWASESEEGIGGYAYMRKLLGSPRIVFDSKVFSRLRSKIESLKQNSGINWAAVEGHSPEEWEEGDDEEMEKAKGFIFDILSSILKTVFPGEASSGTGINYQKLRRINKTPSDGPIEPPAEMEV